MRALEAFAGAASLLGKGLVSGLLNVMLTRLHAALPSLWLFTVLALGAAASARADTMVSGNLEANTRWTQTGSPYVIQDNLYVVGGATLQIDPGVQVYVNPGARVTVLAGTVQALGTATQPVVIQSSKARQDQAAAGDWGPWTFTAGTVNSRLEHVRMAHGQGVIIEGASPTLNHVEWISHRGAAVSVDLKSSPVGVGLKASGCDINGIAVPAGDLTASVRWGLRGIPYVVSGGVLSVGQSPALTSVSPASVERGQTVTLAVNGARLGGLGAVSFDKPGLALTPFSGGSTSQVFIQLVVAPDAGLGPATLRLRVDAGDLELPSAVTVTPPIPAITSISPSSVFAGAGLTTLRVMGRNFSAGAEILVNGAALPTTLVSATELQAPLPNQNTTGSLQIQVRMPGVPPVAQPLLSAITLFSVQAPVPPVLSIEPTPIALPPDGKPRELTLRLSKADYRDNTIMLSVSDTSKASVSPSTVLIPAGQTSAKFTVTPGVNSATLSVLAESVNLAKVSVPLFLTQDFRGANTAYAMPVGVVVQAVAAPVTQEVQLQNLPVGVAVGATLTEVTPRAWVRGGTQVLTIHGRALGSGLQVSLEPMDGLTLGDATVSDDGRSLQVPVTSVPDAPAGPRRLVIKDAQNRLLSFADPAQAVVQLVQGLPVIDSVTPISVLRGTTVDLVVRGQYLHQGQVLISPSSGITVDAQPTISTDGRRLSAKLSVDAAAAPGDYVVQVETAAGQSTPQALAANTLVVGDRLSPAVTPVTSPVVGVVVGSGAPAQDPDIRALQGGLVGVIRGAGVSRVSPRVGVLGTDVTVQVQGMGLDDVSVIRFVPEAGLAVQSGPVASADGRSLTFVVRVDSQASLGLRRLVLVNAAGLPVTAAMPDDGTFLVSAPIPELDSVSPAIVLTGAADVRVTVRGQNLQNTSEVRIEPAAGVRVAGPFVVSDGGRTLSFTLGADAGAASGVRTVVVSTPAGQSTNEPHAGNMVRVAAQVGATYPAISSPVVGVVVQTPVEPPSLPLTAVSSPVGVVLGSASTAPVVIPSRTTLSPVVGVTWGPVVTAITPRGFLQGSAGSLVIEGRNLGVITSASIRPATGLLLGDLVVSADQGQITLPITVSPDAALGPRELRLLTADGPVVYADIFTDREVGIGRIPSVTSISPIIIEQGKAITLTVRGSQLTGVQAVQFLSDLGLTAQDLSVTNDALGQKLSVRVQAAPDAPLGDRAVILTVPGGQTTSILSPANTLKVVPPQ